MSNTLRKMLVVCVCEERGAQRSDCDFLGKHIKKSSPDSEIVTIYFPVCHLVHTHDRGVELDDL